MPIIRRDLFDSHAGMENRSRGGPFYCTPNRVWATVLQFIRYASFVKPKSGGTVLLECHAAPMPLFKSFPGVDKILVQGEALPDFDVHAPLLSLPRIFGTSSLGQIPAKVPYVAVDPDRVELWRKRLESVEGFRVGIVWQGNRKNTGDRWRSVPLEKFASLANIPG